MDSTLKAEIEGEWTTEEGREFHKVIVLGKKEYKKLEVRAKGLQRVKECCPEDGRPSRPFVFSGGCADLLLCRLAPLFRVGNVIQ